MKIIGEFLY